VDRRRAEHLVEAEFKDWKESFNQNPFFSVLCLPSLRMTSVIPVSAGFGMAVITWKLSTYNYPCSSAWGWEGGVEDTFAVGNTPVTAGFAYVCLAQAGKPCGGTCLLPIRISRKEYFLLLLLWTIVGCCSAGDTFGYSQQSPCTNGIVLVMFWVSRSTFSPCQEHPSENTPVLFAAHSMCGFTKLLV